MEEYDVAVIGGGPGGYPAAIKLAQGGLKVVLIEAEKMGGTCLNRGCIPTKTLIASADVLKKVKFAGEFGISTGKVSFDFSKMNQRKDRVVKEIRASLEGLIAANQIRILNGFGKFISPNEIKVIGNDSCRVWAKKIIIATGSEPKEMGSFPFDHQKILDSTSLLNLQKLPKSLAIIGAGYIGSEFASLFNELGTNVTLIEALSSIIPTEGVGISNTLHQAFEKSGINILLETFVDRIETQKKSVKIFLRGKDPIEAEIALVAVGRKLNSDNIGLEKVGIQTEVNGAIPIDQYMRTSVPNIYAIGDVTAKMMLAHVASHQGIIAAEHILGKEIRMNYQAIPSIVFTHPEVATVGLSLEDALDRGIPAKIGRFPFQALGKSQAAMETEGFAQIVVHKQTGQVLGAQVVGYEAGTLIAEMGIAVANELTVESVSETIHAHPTIAEAWLEAAMLAQDTPLHLPPKKKKTFV